MKKGCLFLLVILAGAYAAYYYLFKGTEYEASWWVPCLLALGDTIVIANILGIFQALRQTSAAKRPRSEWRDGDLVAAWGPIQPMRAAVNAPFTGTPAAIAEYAVKLESQIDDSSAVSTHYQGFLMTACGVYSSEAGLVRLVGFPLLGENLTKHITVDAGMLKRAAEYFHEAKFVEQSSNPIKALKQLADVLSDDDGVVRADFCKGGTAHNLEEYDDSEEYEFLDEEEEQEARQMKAAELAANPDAPAAGASTNSEPNPIEKISQALRSRGYRFEERVIKAGEEVTAIGTYRADQQAIDIGSGLKNLAHSLQIGAAAKVTAGNLKRSVLAVIFWGGVVGYSNWYILKNIGLIH